MNLFPTRDTKMLVLKVGPVPMEVSLHLHLLSSVDRVHHVASSHRPLCEW